MPHHFARRAVCALGALLLTAWSQHALSFPATVTDLVHLRAGPSIEYPSVALLGRGSTVEVFGCEDGYGWCDAQIGTQRGWVDAAYLMAQGPFGTGGHRGQRRGVGTCGHTVRLQHVLGLLLPHHAVVRAARLLLRVLESIPPRPSAAAPALSSALLPPAAATTAATTAPDAVPAATDKCEAATRRGRQPG